MKQYFNWKGGKPKCQDCSKILGAYHSKNRKAKRCWECYKRQWKTIIIQCEICKKNLNKIQKRFCSLKCVGIDSSKRMKGNIFGKGNSTRFTAEKMLEEKNPNWKGEKVGYDSLHDWVHYRLGKPTKCEYCGKDNLIGHKIHWANKSRKYYRDIKDWIRLCAKCHWHYDHQ